MDWLDSKVALSGKKRLLTDLSLARLFLFVFFLTSLTAAEPVADGFYIVSETTPVDRYVGTGPHRFRLRYETEFSGDSAPVWVFVDQKPFVPLEITSLPSLSVDASSPSRLCMLAPLTKRAFGSLASLSAERLGTRIAVVVDGEVTYLYTIHRRPEHAPFIIARCGDGSCKALFRNLEDNVKTDK